MSGDPRRLTIDFLVVLRRLFVALCGIALSSVVVFISLRVLPGDIATTRLGIDATPEALAALRDEYGLDQSYFSQYVDWIGNAVRGDLGTSMVTGDDVGSEIISRLDVTMPLIIASSVLSVTLAVWLGRRTTLRRGQTSGVIADALSQIGGAVPTFVVGVFLITVFAVQLRLLPAGGFPTEGWRDPLDALRSLLLPLLCLAASQSSVLVRFARSHSLDYVASDAFRTARSVGRNSDAAMATARRLVLTPVLGVTALQIATLLTGAVVVESVFALPGIGSMLIRDIANRDLPKVQSTLLLVVVLVFLVRFVVDVIVDRLDPRRLS